MASDDPRIDPNMLRKMQAEESARMNASVMGGARLQKPYDRPTMGAASLGDAVQGHERDQCATVTPTRPMTFRERVQAEHERYAARAQRLEQLMSILPRDIPWDVDRVLCEMLDGYLHSRQ